MELELEAVQEMQQANVPIVAPEDEDEAEALFQQALKESAELSVGACVNIYIWWSGAVWCVWCCVVRDLRDHARDAELGDAHKYSLTDHHVHSKLPLDSTAEAEQILAADQHLVSPGKDLSEGKEAEGKDGGKEADVGDAPFSPQTQKEAAAVDAELKKQMDANLMEMELLHKQGAYGQIVHRFCDRTSARTHPARAWPHRIAA